MDKVKIGGGASRSRHSRPPRPPHRLPPPSSRLQLYRTLGIRVVLVGLEIWTDQDRFEVESSSDKTLDKFLLWRRSDLLPRAEHDNAQLVT